MYFWKIRNKWITPVVFARTWSEHGKLESSAFWDKKSKMSIVCFISCGFQQSFPEGAEGTLLFISYSSSLHPGDMWARQDSSVRWERRRELCWCLKAQKRAVSRPSGGGLVSGISTLALKIRCFLFSTNSCSSVSYRYYRPSSICQKTLFCKGSQVRGGASNQVRFNQS